MARVLVLGEETRIILPIIRSLGRKGIAVDAAWCPADAPAMRSRYLRQVVAIPPYSAGSEEWKDALLARLRRMRYDLVIPATEPAVFAIDRHRREFDPLAPIALPDPHALEVVTDKAKTWALAESLGVCVPASLLVASTGDLDSASAFLERYAPTPGVVVKPCSSVAESAILDKCFVQTASGAEDTRAQIEKGVASGRRYLLQERVPGTGVGVEVLASEGKVLLAFQHRRLHETSGYGSTYRESCRLSPVLLSASQRLLAALGYTGVAMVEYRVDFPTGKWALLEVNGRFWGSLPLAAAAGVDFPFALYEMLITGRTTFPSGYRVGVRARNLLNDLRWFWRWLRRAPGRDAEAIGWAINRRSALDVLGDLLRMLTFQDHLDSFAHDDPRPLFAEIGQLLALRSRHQPEA
jgi:predicted ATP-grasp superfamily ATP-dependent carboligase